MTTILHKRGNGIPEANQFESVGEILIDTDTGIAYTLTDAGEVSPVGGEEFDGTVESPLIVDGTGNADYNKARITAKTKSSINQDFNLTFEAGQLSNYGQWYQKTRPYLYVEDVNGSEIEQRSDVSLGSYSHKFGNAYLSGDLYCDGVLHQYGLPVVDTPETNYALAFNAERGRWQECGKVLLEPTRGDQGVDFYTLHNTNGPMQATDYLDADGNSIIGAGDGDDYVNANESEYSISLGTLSADQYSVAVGMRGNLGGYVSTEAVGVGFDAKVAQSGVAVGTGTEARTSAVAVGRGAQAWSSAIAIGSGTWAMEDFSVAIGTSARTEESQQVMFGATPDNQYGKPLNLKTYGTMQAKDYLDADGNSVVNKQQVLTQSEYDSLTPDPDTVYFII